MAALAREHDEKQATLLELTASVAELTSEQEEHERTLERAIEDTERAAKLVAELEQTLTDLTQERQSVSESTTLQVRHHQKADEIDCCFRATARALVAERQATAGQSC